MQFEAIIMKNVDKKLWHDTVYECQNSVSRYTIP